VTAVLHERRPVVAARVCLLRPALGVVRPRHDQEAWKPVEEDRSDPPWHAVRSRRLEVPVDDDDGYEDSDDVHDEREEKIFSNERDCHRCRRKNLRHQQQEDDQSQQDGNTHRHLFPSVSREVENTDAQKRYENTRNDQINGVEEGFAPDS